MLSDVSEHLEYGIGASAINFNGKHRYIRITDISNWGKNEITSPSFIEKSAILNDGDILLARTGATVGDSFIYKDDGVESYFAGFLIRAKVQKANPYFVYYQLKTLKYAQWVKISSARSGQPGINSEQFGSYRICITEYNEQQKIANFLKAIDERIEAQNKIIEDLNKLKKSLIEDNFTNTELSVSLKEVLKERKTYSEKGLEYEHVTLSKDGIIPKGERYDRDFLVVDESKKYKITKLNDICYNPANLKFGVICLNNYKDSIFSPIYVTFEVNKKYDPYYVSIYLTSDKFIMKILKYQQGTVYERMCVNPDDFLKGRLPIIKNHELFINLIKTIEYKCIVEKEQLKNYEIQKEYLLRNMFI